MAYYNYKYVRDLMPKEFKEKWIEQYNIDAKKYGTKEYIGDGNYDGDQWLLVGAYIEYLHQKLGYQMILEVLPKNDRGFSGKLRI